MFAERALSNLATVNRRVRDKHTDVHLAGQILCSAPREATLQTKAIASRPFMKAANHLHLNDL